MLEKREAVGFAAVLLGAAALAAVSHHPTHGRRTERERAAVEAAADQFTHQQIVDAWNQATLGNAQPLKNIQGTFPLPVRTVHQEGPGVILTFLGHQETCIDFISQPGRSIVTAHRC